MDYFNYYKRDWSDYANTKKGWEEISSPKGKSIWIDPEGKVHARGFVDINDNLELYVENNEIKSKFSEKGESRILSLKADANYTYVMNVHDQLFAAFQNFSNAVHQYDSKKLPEPHQRYNLLSIQTKRDIQGQTSSMSDPRAFHFKHLDDGSKIYVEPYVEETWLGPYNFDVHIKPHGTIQETNDLLVIKSGRFLSSAKEPIEYGVNAVTYTTGMSGHVYLDTISVPNHPMGPFDGAPAGQVKNDLRQYKFKHHENVLLGPATTPTGVGHDIIGVLENGVFVHSPGNGLSVGGSGFWNGNAMVADRAVIDDCEGMLQTDTNLQDENAYLYRGMSRCLDSEYGGTGLHSPVIGYAKDGFPIYGPYGYTNSQDNTSALKRLEPSYRLKQVSVRAHPSGNGPSFTGLDQNDVVFESGYFLEDYEFVNGLGDLDAHNGRSGITPDFPNGTYSYFATVDIDHAPVYPYVVGTGFYGNLHDLSDQGYGGTVTEAPLYVRDYGSTAWTEANHPKEISLWNVFGYENRTRRGLASETIIWVSPHVSKTAMGT